MNLSHPLFQSPSPSEKLRPLWAAPCHRVQSSGVRWYARGWAHAGGAWWTRAGGQGRWAMFPLPSVRCLYSHNTGFLVVQCLIYPCQWVCRNSIYRGFSKPPLQFSELHNSDPRTRYSRPTLTIYSNILHSLSLLFSRSFAPEDVISVTFMYRAFYI